MASGRKRVYASVASSVSSCQRQTVFSPSVYIPTCPWKCWHEAALTAAMSEVGDNGGRALDDLNFEYV
uniref:Uncharacterized protein n=1 Tax=Panagrellus redivivus TaxID=6233 RepID=A0A7E5A105_PANRE